MNSRFDVLKTELNSLHQRENMMYNYYNEVFGQVRDPEIKEKIRVIRNQELGHIKIVNDILVILRADIEKGL